MRQAKIVVIGPAHSYKHTLAEMLRRMFQSYGIEVELHDTDVSPLWTMDRRFPENTSIKSVLDTLPEKIILEVAQVQRESED